VTEFVGVAEFSLRLGVSTTAVRKAIRTGRVTSLRAAPGTGHMEIAWPRAAEEWQANTDPLRRTHVGPRSGSSGAQQRDLAVRLPTASSGPGDGSATALSYADARTRREAYEARLAKLEYEEKAGLLVTIAKVRANAFNLGRQVRDGLLNIPDRLAHELAGEARVERVREILTREIEVTLAPLGGAVP
jgi:hypothetical protein